MRKFALTAAIASLFILGACTTATPYQEATDSQKGYISQKIESDRWQISFAGNSLTDRKTVETYLLYRAAELTDAEGFDHFRVVQRATDASRKFVPSGFGHDPFYSRFPLSYRFYGRRGRLYGYRDPFWEDPWDYREIVRYEASTEIIMGQGETPDDPSFFNADEVLMNLAGQIIRPDG